MIWQTFILVHVAVSKVKYLQLVIKCIVHGSLDTPANGDFNARTDSIENFKTIVPSQDIHAGVSNFEGLFWGAIVTRNHHLGIKIRKIDL